jgi:hypothetical protein
MADGDDLPDHDYASIYGHAALHARRLARLDALLRAGAAQTERLRRLEEQLRRLADAPPKRG